MVTARNRFSWACLSVLLAILCMQTGCEVRSSPSPRSAPVASQPAPVQPVAVPEGPAALPPGPPVYPSAPMPTPKPVASFDHEPVIGVFLTSGTSVSLHLVHSGSSLIHGHRVAFRAGALSFWVVGEGMRSTDTGGRDLGEDVVIQTAARGAAFSVNLDSPFGRPGTTTHLRLAGMPVLHFDRRSRKIQLIERVPLEIYLAGVLVGEVNKHWPIESLKAQAIVARSYATDRYLKNADQPWQLHWHFTVDMSYAGWTTLPNSIASALEQTRGQVLLYRHLPVPALFHACSGGRTESAQHFRPDLKGADGVTDMTVVMPSVDDSSAIAGANALGFSQTHLNWHAALPLSVVTANLQRWHAAHPLERITFGRVENVRVIARFPDSGRVDRVGIRQLFGDQHRESQMSAADFRLAVGPGEIRSTDWSSCRVEDGILSISGHGYGHGVGMSQVSAYQMASSGQSATEILAHFYPGANLEHCWP